jgi:hypothetical protein
VAVFGTLRISEIASSVFWPPEILTASAAMPDRSGETDGEKGNPYGKEDPLPSNTQRYEGQAKGQEHDPGCCFRFHLDPASMSGKTPQTSASRSALTSGVRKRAPLLRARRRVAGLGWAQPSLATAATT